MLYFLSMNTMSTGVFVAEIIILVFSLLLALRRKDHRPAQTPGLVFTLFFVD